MLTVLVVFFLGLIAGSFVSAVVWRVKAQEKGKNSGKYSILKGRSVCPHCKHILAAKDLIPLLSWLSLRGRCRYCGKPISKQYPAIELGMAVVFVISYSYWPDGLFGAGAWTLFIAWIITSVGLMALLVYDFKWMILPNRLIYPTLAVAVAGRFVYIFAFDPEPLRAFGNWGLSIIVASGFFWLLYVFSKGRLIGYGDVRLGLITGTVLASPSLSLMMLFLSSLLGLAFAAPSLVSGKKHMTSRLPYGPFLIMATFITLLVGQDVIDWYKRLLG